ncbi:hypothetical protein [Streptomyces sp. NPDC059979]|uniref:hypothetical protein n=1 Tax=unclassified Streptomyces TaxID=2593676 RepID=UPI0036693FF1
MCHLLLRNHLEHRRAAHDQYIEPARHDCDMTVDGSVPAATLAHQIWSAIAGTAPDPT